MKCNKVERKFNGDDRGFKECDKVEGKLQPLQVSMAIKINTANYR